MKALRTASFIMMVLVTIFFVLFAYIRAQYAKDAQSELEQQRMEIANNQKVLEMLKDEAERMAATARIAENKVLEINDALENCKKK